MSKESDRLKKVGDTIIGIEMHLTLLHSDSMAIDRDLEFLRNLEQLLTENVEVLKEDKIIAVAAEYKRVKEELKTAKKNIEAYLSIKAKLERDIFRYSTNRDMYLIEYDELKKQIERETIVLIFDASKRKKK